MHAVPTALGPTDGSFRLPRPRRQPPAPAEPPERPGEAILPRQGRGGALSPARRSSAGPPERRRRESTVERARSRRAQWCPQLYLLRQRATAGCAWAGPPTRCEAGENRGFGGRRAGRGERGAHRLERRGEGTRTCWCSLRARTRPEARAAPQKPTCARGTAPRERRPQQPAASCEGRGRRSRRADKSGPGSERACGGLQLDVLQLGRLAGGGSEAPKGAGKHIDSGGPEREPTVN